MSSVLPFRVPTTQRIYFPVDDEYVVVGQLAPDRYTAHMETGDGCGRGSTMLEAIADLVASLDESLLTFSKDWLHSSH